MEEGLKDSKIVIIDATVGFNPALFYKEIDTTASFLEMKNTSLVMGVLSKTNPQQNYYDDLLKLMPNPQNNKQESL